MILSVSGNSFSAPPHDPGEAVLAAGDDGRSCSVAEQGGRYDCSRIGAVETDRDRAGLDGHEQPVRPRLRGGKPRGRREAVDPTGAAEAEYRNPADVVPKPQPRTDARFKARRGNARGRNGDHSVDLVGRQAGLFYGRTRRLDEQALGSFQIDGIAIMPAVGGHVPFLRSNDVAPGDAGIVEDAGQAVEQGLLTPEGFAGAYLRIPLLDDMRWNRSRE